MIEVLLRSAHARLEPYPGESVLSHPAYTAALRVALGLREASSEHLVVFDQNVNFQHRTGKADVVCVPMSWIGDGTLLVHNHPAHSDIALSARDWMTLVTCQAGAVLLATHSWLWYIWRSGKPCLPLRRLRRILEEIEDWLLAGDNQRDTLIAIQATLCGYKIARCTWKGVEYAARFAMDRQRFAKGSQHTHFSQYTDSHQDTHPGCHSNARTPADEPSSLSREHRSNDLPRRVAKTNHDETPGAATTNR